MNLNNHKSAINATIVAASLAYLLFPNLLFLLGWVQWWYSLPVAALLIGAGIYICWHLPCTRICIGSHPVLGLLLILLVCFLAVESLGYSGRVPQSSDFLVRNPMYDTLVQCDWPLKSSTGDYFVYYHIFYLPPALISRILEEIASPTTILYLWTFVGLLLVAALVALRFGALKGALALSIILAQGYLTDWIRVLYSATEQLRIIDPNTISHLRSYLPLAYTDAMASNWRAAAIDSPHHAIPLLLLLVLVATARISPKHIFFTSSLVVLASPYGAIGIIIFLIIKYQYFIRQNMVTLIKGISWIGVLLLIPAAAFFSSTDGRIAIHSLFATSYSDSTRWLFLYFTCIALTLGPAFYFIDRRYRKTAPFIFFAGAIITLQFITNPTSSNHYNTVLKLFAVVSFCQAWLYIPAFFRATGKKKVLCGLFFLAASCYAILHSGKQVYFFSTDPVEQRKNSQLGWNGHMNHPDQHYYRNFFTNAQIPFILYQDEGESSRHLLAPFATGIKASHHSP